MALPQLVQHPRTMATHSPLKATTDYLRFPLSPDHRAPVRNGDVCPHCNGRHLHKWGTFSGRQRYRCRVCERTFSTFTGTALSYLKHPERWRHFLWCVDGRLTVRASAAALGVNKDTALRWRHRLLAQWRGERQPRLTGSIVIGDFCLPHSDKGRRMLTRPARRHGEPWSFPFDQTGPVTVLVARERPTERWERAGKVTQRPGTRRAGRMVIERVGVGRGIRSRDYDERIAPRIHDVAAIVGCRGVSSPLAGFARRQGIRYLHESKSFFPREVFVVRRELRAWLRPFRGVATRRLDNYLEWFRRRGWPRPASTLPTDRARCTGRPP